jgi:hypothetical protein
MPYGEAVPVHIADVTYEQSISMNSKLSHLKHITLSCLQNPSFKFRLGVCSLEPPLAPVYATVQKTQVRS